ncbi:type II secretion system protein N [Novilysobacter erysipheiresistens]|uniref:Type II secretion system protein N n=1 Tax=Novilysobacter erysipheiresistens TaxID=1749332 RepID=A0ABU7YUX7_9GAMM
MHALSRLRSRIETVEWQAWLPGAVEIVVVTLLALQLARLAWLVLAPARPIVEAAAPATLAAPAPSLPTVDVFFRSAAVASAGSDEAFGYHLFGVRSESGSGGSAILGKDGDQASYAVGREVAPGVVLTSVGAEHAVLAANGARHRLDLPRIAAMDANAKPGTLPVGTPPRPASAEASSASTNASTAAPTTPRPTSPPIAPSTVAGGGYTITPGVRAAMLRPTGLRPGDVVLSVDGRPLDPARLAGLRDELKGKSQLTIQYRRDGKTHTTTVQAPR